MHVLCKIILYGSYFLVFDIGKLTLLIYVPVIFISKVSSEVSLLIKSLKALIFESKKYGTAHRKNLQLLNNKNKKPCIQHGL